MSQFMISVLVILFSGSVMAKEMSQTVCYAVEGMTCATCAITLKAAVNKLDGIVQVDASVKKKNAIVKFDPKKVSPEAISEKIDSVGYKSNQKQCLKAEG